ncbi:MAG TPA: ribonuclease H-like domain-containing protein [Candidatus Limnocylindrales bacterium]|nr:ribonuclease H-like domain-containing protein [Candidatus Limnocylindrales bacterium]
MTVPALGQATTASTDLARRLERFRSAIRADDASSGDALPHAPIAPVDLAERLATTLDGEVVASRLGRFVRVEGRATELPIDRARLAVLPGHPPADRPLVCLDTETTGLATAAGTVAFLIGLGWWAGATFRQVQIVLPDHADEGALLEELARHIPADAWLVTYNGRGFDWPLLVTRYRMERRAAPVHAGHLDLLPIVRRLFRHRMDDARLRTVERSLLGLERHDDVDGWDIPARYLGFLRGGPAHPLRAVVRHNDEDVRSLARLIALLDAGYTTADARRRVPLGDVAGLARAFARERRHDEALSCLDEILGREDAATRTADPSSTAVARAGLADRSPGARVAEVPWWSPGARADFGGPPRPAHGPSSWHRTAAFSAGWDAQRVAVDRAHLLRRLGRYRDSADAWRAVAAGHGRAAVVAWIEVAKLREHRLSDRPGALDAAERGLAAAERRRQLGMPDPRLERDLAHRAARLRTRLGSTGRRTLRAAAALDA